MTFQDDLQTILRGLDFKPHWMHQKERQAEALAALDRVRERTAVLAEAARGILWHEADMDNAEERVLRAALAALDESPASTEERT